MNFGFVGCLAFSNYFKLLHVIRLSFARTAFFFICSLMALLLDLDLTWVETKTLQILLESIFVHSAAHGFSSRNLLFHFKFDLTWVETKTLQILLESIFVHSAAHGFSYFSLLGLRFLFRTRFSLLWNLPFPLHATVLIFSLSCRGAALTHQDSFSSHDLN